jgi:hypothetical protein
LGEYDAAVREWESKTGANKTWPTIKRFISTEYAKENKQNKLTAKQFKENLMEEQAKATKKLIANLTKAHTEQMELLIKAMTESMKEMMNLMKALVKNPTTTTSDEKKKKGKNSKRNSKTHLYANIATRNTPQSKKANAGNSKPMRPPA